MATKERSGYMTWKHWRILGWNARVQGSEYYCIKGAAHYAFIEAPLEWMQATEKWLTSKKF